MKPVKVLSTAGILAITAVLSCTKQENANPVTEKHPVASISIVSPYSEQVIKYGDTVKIIADVTSDSKMHGCEILILNPGNDTLFSDDSHEHGTTMNVRKEWINSVNENTTLTLKIICIMDHDGNTCKKTQNIHTQQD